MLRTQSTDVVVVGGGGAGLAAAIEGASSGAAVVLFEKEAALGGSTAWSVGSISVAGSPHQRRAGIADSAEAHFEDLGLLAGAAAKRDNLALRGMLVENIAETFAWLESHGLVFVGPSPEPPHRVPRMHNVVPSSRAFPARLGRAARRLGVSIRLGERVTSLTIEDARVTGVRSIDARGEERVWPARRGVVLAGGDYSAAPDLLGELAGEAAASLAPVNPAATGDGLRLGRAAGGRIVNGDLVRGPVMRFVPPPRRPWLERLPPHPALAHAMRLGYAHLPWALLRPFLMRFLTTALGLSPGLLAGGAMLLNARGERYAGGVEGAAAWSASQPGGRAWVLLDQTLADRFSAWPHYVSTAPGVAYAYLDDYRRARPDVYGTAATPSGVARLGGWRESAVEKALGEHRAAAGNRRHALARGPFHLLGPVRAYVAFTEGGLAVDEGLRVLGPLDAPIPGLWAAGANGQGGALLEGHGHHLGWAFVSGRIAGRNAAAALGYP